MAFFKFREPYRIRNYPNTVIVLLLLVYVATNFSHHNWTRDDGPDRGVIKWDIISYYAYLPATFIHGDPSLDFLDEGKIDNDNKFWWSPAPNGRKIIYVSCGLSILYAPFFFLAHLLAPVFGETRDGFSSIYQFFLVFGALVYLALGLLCLKKVLLRYFTPQVTAITLLVLGLGTNLYYYATHEAVMSHSYNFSLIAIFFYTLLRWYEDPTWLRTFWMGLLFGLIVLIRPSNILVLVLLLLWGVDSWEAGRERIRFFLRNIPKVILMVLAFGIPWIPQVLYWRMITGEFLFYSYGPHGDRFYWDNPHLMESLFSYRKGWLLYTPVMAIAIAGLAPLKKRIRGSLLPVTVYLLLMIYVMSSWWMWWFGGGFGGRIYIDTYGILALPLAAIIAAGLDWKGKPGRYGFLGILVFLVCFLLLQTRQYAATAIHWDSMSKKAYWHTFLRLRPRVEHVQSNLLSIPDEELCRKGIYVYYDQSEDWSVLKTLTEEEGIQLIIGQISRSRTLPGEIRRHARREGLSHSAVTRATASRMRQMRLRQMP
jgi:hypothetical protein